MGRFLLIVGLVVAWPLIARADTSVRIDITDITIEVPGDWKLMESTDDHEQWQFLDRADQAGAIFVFFKGGDERECRGMNDMWRTIPARPKGEFMIGGTCIATARAHYILGTMVPINVELNHDPETLVLQRYTAALIARDGDMFSTPTESSTSDDTSDDSDPPSEATTPSEPSEPTTPSEPTLAPTEASDPSASEAAPTTVATADEAKPVDAEASATAAPAPGRPLWILPNAITLGVVHHAGDVGATGWGAGLEISRQPWRGASHFAIGYAVAVAGAKDWLAVDAQVRPGMWLGIDHATRIDRTLGGVLNAYLVGGVGGTTGGAAPAVDFAPIFGGGLEGFIFNHTYAVDLGVQVTADPSGLHGHHLKAGLLLGHDEHHMVGVDISYVSNESAGGAWWLSLQFANYARER